VTLRQAQTVTASFAPKGARREASLLLQLPVFRVAWKASLGKGALLVTGRAGRAASLTFDMRRPGGGPLLHVTRKLDRTGSFRLAQRLPSRLFPRGAKLLPGGFVFSLRGTAKGYYLPRQLKTVALRGPREGVVRLSFASTTQNGKTVHTFPSSTRITWANFRFQQQPAAGLALRVNWYWPNGHVLGSVIKGNRPVVSSFLRSGRPIPAGTWRAELWVGSKLVKRQLVSIKR
jgi:hypothetical protein